MINPPSSDFRRRQGYGGTGRRGKAAVFFLPPGGWEFKRPSRPKRPNPMFMGFLRLAKRPKRHSGTLGKVSFGQCLWALGRWDGSKRGPWLPANDANCTKHGSCFTHGFLEKETEVTKVVRVAPE